jgi:four helix bundle protein
VKNFRELKVWEKAHKLVIKVYGLTKKFPKEEVYGLTSQIRRSCTSIPTNIAEGCGRDSQLELTRFLVIAMGSANELEYLLLLANDLRLMEDGEHKVISNDLIEVKKMLSSFINKLKADR